MGHAFQLLETLKAHFEPVLELSALILGIVNGLFLLKFYLRDRPKLKVKPVHSKVYQWWFRMPDDQHEGQKCGFRKLWRANSGTHTRLVDPAR